MNRRWEGLFWSGYTFVHKSASGGWLLIQCSVLGAATLAVRRTNSIYQGISWVPCLLLAPMAVLGYMQPWFDLKLPGEFSPCGSPSHFRAAALILNMFNMLDKNKLLDNMKEVQFSDSGVG